VGRPGIDSAMAYRVLFSGGGSGDSDDSPDLEL
jgi:hypothetical protein